jgi:hypothetical protein
MLFNGYYLMEIFLYGINLGVPCGLIFMNISPMKPCILHYLLWSLNPKRWNIDLLNSIFDPEFVSSVLQIPLLQSPLGRTH